MSNLFDSIYFPYGATTAPYSAARPHRGNDYKANEGTPLVVQGVQIGLVGSTGNTTGPHVHVQAGRDEWAQSPIDPLPFTDKPGTVVKTGTASEWGNYVCVRVGDVNVFYCHMSRVDVSVGTVIRGGDVSQEEIDKLWKALDATNKRIDQLVNGKDGVWVRINETNVRVDALEKDSASLVSAAAAINQLKEALK